MQKRSYFEMKPNPEKADSVLKGVFPLVGIGASAGGMKALEAFLCALPPEFRFALVFIQHLSPAQKSLLPELLRNRVPGLDVVEIADRMRVRPGRLYLCPAGMEVRLGGGFFRVAPGPEGHTHYPIDEFFESLATEARENAVAVILSGAGTDGARGINAVRAVGGCVYVQDPETAEFQGMPLAAIGTGSVDGILSPGGISAEILKLLETAGETGESPDAALAPEEYQAFYRMIHQKTGQSFVHYKKTVISRRVRRRMYLSGIRSVTEYLDLVARRDDEASALATDLMIGVTAFYRDKIAWRALKQEVVRQLIDGESNAPLRVWTPACATGEESYSIAMLLLHELGERSRRRELMVFATDVNDAALERAREARYPASVAADLPHEFLRKYFTLSADGQSVIVTKGVRDCVVFARQDLVTDPPFSRLDLVICRNLLIYLEPEAQERCISLFHYALRTGGFLFLGNAESAGRSLGLFTPVGHKKCRIYRKDGDKDAARPQPPAPLAVGGFPAGPGRQVMAAGQRHDRSRMIQDTLIEEYAPAAVAIDSGYTILYHSGPTNRYLSQPRGVPTQNLLELVPGTLVGRIRSAVYRAGKESRPVSVRGTLPGDGRKKAQVTLRFSKLGDGVFLVVFREKSGSRAEAGPVLAEPDAEGAEAFRLLEAELAATRADLQGHIEQFTSLNEELHSSNEELQAANEELETGREELQSLNEELITVNSQLQEKIVEQEELNNDLTNFLTSTSMPTFFLDHQFRVKRFTPAMSRLLKLIPSDLGRPIMDLSQENLGPDLINDATAVLGQLAPIRKEVHIGGDWYVRAVLPYRTSDNRIEGVVVTYNDISDLKRAEECNARLASFPQLNPNPVIEVDLSGKVSYANAAAARMLESLGLDSGDFTPLLPKDLEAIVAAWDRKTESSLSREFTVKDRAFGASVQLAPQFGVARIYAFEITGRKRAEEAILRAKEEWELTFDSVPDLIALIDNDHRIRRVNKAMARKMGLSPEQCVGLRCYEHVHGTTSPPLFCPHSRTILDGQTHVAEVCEERLGGDFSVTTTPLIDAGGNRIGSVHVAHDITARKKAEALSGRLAALVRSADDAIIAEDMHGIIQSWNVGAEKIFGYTEEESLGRNISFLIPPGHRDEVPDIIERISRGEHIEHFESLRRRKDGTVVPVSLTFSAIRDSGGKIIGISKIAHNIAERKQAEEALQQSLSRIELLTWTAGELLQSTEPQKAVESVCRKVMEQLDCHTFFNFLADEKAGKLRLNAYAGIPEEEARKIEWLDYGVAVCGCAARDAQRIVAEHIPSTPDERTELVKSYGVKAYACHPLTGPGGKVIGTLSFGTCGRETFGVDDLSLMKAVADQVAVAMMRISGEQALRQRTDELEEANKELESFSYSVSHDLRAPLRHISGFVRIISEDYGELLDSQGKDYLARIHNGSERMTRLIDDLLHLSRISRQEMSRERVDLSAVVSSVASELREAAPGRQAEVHIREGLYAQADLRLIMLALRNLLENAWKFTSNSGNARIEFDAIEKEGRTVYYVKDNGAGFDQEFAGRMFWPFHRLHTEQEFEGTGIGLAIVERVIRRHGGKVWAEGQPGNGATIYFTLE